MAFPAYSKTCSVKLVMLLFLTETLKRSHYSR